RRPASPLVVLDVLGHAPVVLAFAESPLELFGRLGCRLLPAGLEVPGVLVGDGRQEVGRCSIHGGREFSLGRSVSVIKTTPANTKRKENERRRKAHQQISLTASEGTGSPGPQSTSWPRRPVLGTASGRRLSRAPCPSARISTLPPGTA
ncbi:hypothetical protein CH063_10659, partial [Colletotrichum higginsianum]